MRTDSPGAKWHISDLFDLEYFLKQDAEEKSGIKKDADDAWDRRIYLAFAESHTPPYSRRDLLKFWLDEKRKKETAATGGTGLLPGGMFDEILSLARLAIIITALPAGIALAWSVLSYRGDAPINIFTCLWIFIFPQVLMLIMLGGMSVFRRIGLPSGQWGFYPLLAFLLRKAALFLKSAGEDRFSAERRQRMNAAFGMIGRHKTIYGPVFYRPVFVLLQMFGVCFNIGLLATALFKITITDLAFGWQTTLAAGAEAMHRVVEWIALPWSWLSFLFPAHPTLSQIQGSRIILKDGLAHLATPDLASWWPFLVMTVVVYGLLPRVLLLAYGITAQARNLKALDFSHSACDRLIRRMQVPQVETGGVKPPAPGIPLGRKPALSASAAGETEVGAIHVITGVPEENDVLCADDDLTERIGHLLGPFSYHRFCLTMDPEADAATLQSLLSEIHNQDGDIRVLLVQDAWLPPIRETLSWIRAMRHAVGPRTGMIIGLVGKPGPANLFTPPADADRIIWDRAVAALGDPYLRTESLGG
jgi:hypothetical protein